VITTIRGIENRTAPLSEDEFRFLARSPQFRLLADAGYAAVTLGRKPARGLRGGAFVGQAVLENGVRLVIEPKIPGALDSLLEWTLPKDLRETTLLAPIETVDQSKLLVHFSRRFADRLGDYVQHGRIKEYKHRLLATSTPRGRLAVSETIRIRARGRVGQVVVARPELTGDLLAHRVLVRAIDIANRILGGDASSRSWMVRLRMYSELFNRTDAAQLDHLDAVQLVVLLDQVLRERGLPPSLREALGYGRALILGLGHWPDQTWAAGPAGAVFVNLATLWQDALIGAMRRVVARAIQVDPGGQLHRKFIDRAAGAIEANPDFVLHDAGQVYVVGDCKYKELESRGKPPRPEPGVDDVYQLYSHCAAFGTSSGLLLYPGERPARHVLGTAPGGYVVQWATLRPSKLLEDLAETVPELMQSAS
jgi:hypothetical protein